MFSLLAQTALPPPETIRNAAQEVVSRPDYMLDAASRSEAMPLLLRLIRWLIKPFVWLFDSMEGWPDSVRWFIVILCVLALIGLIAHMIYSFAAAIRGPAALAGRAYKAAESEIDPSALEQAAERAGTVGDYIGAVRLLFRAALRRIEIAEKKKLRPGFTNRELLRRYQSSPMFGSLRQFAETIDHKWYGGGACLEADFLTCRREHDRIREYVQQPGAIVGA